MIICSKVRRHTEMACDSYFTLSYHIRVKNSDSARTWNFLQKIDSDAEKNGLSSYIRSCCMLATSWETTAKSVNYQVLKKMRIGAKIVNNKQFLRF